MNRFAVLVMAILVAGCAAPSLVCNVKDGRAQVTSKVGFGVVTSEPLKDADAYCADLMQLDAAPEVAPKGKRK